MPAGSTPPKNLWGPAVGKLGGGINGTLLSPPKKSEVEAPLVK